MSTTILRVSNGEGSRDYPFLYQDGVLTFDGKPVPETPRNESLYQELLKNGDDPLTADVFARYDHFDCLDDYIEDGETARPVAAVLAFCIVTGKPHPSIIEINGLIFRVPGGKGVSAERSWDDLVSRVTSMV